MSGWKKIRKNMKNINNLKSRNVNSNSSKSSYKSDPTKINKLEPIEFISNEATINKTAVQSPLSPRSKNTLNKKKDELLEAENSVIVNEKGKCLSTFESIPLPSFEDLENEMTSESEPSEIIQDGFALSINASDSLIINDENQSPISVAETINYEVLCKTFSEDSPFPFFFLNVVVYLSFFF